MGPKPNERDLTLPAPLPQPSSSLFEIPEALIADLSRPRLPKPSSFVLGIAAAILLSGGFLLLLAPLIIWVLWFWVVAQEPGTSEARPFGAGHVVVDRADGKDGQRHHAMLAVVWCVPALCLAAFTLLLLVVAVQQAGGPQGIELLALIAACFGLPAALMARRTAFHVRAIRTRGQELARGGPGRLAFSAWPPRLGDVIDLAYARPLSLHSGARSWRATLRIEERRRVSRTVATKTILERTLDQAAFHRTRWGLRAAWRVELDAASASPPSDTPLVTYSYWLTLVVDAGTVDSRFEIQLQDAR
jgi:hypothetical protein